MGARFRYRLAPLLLTRQWDLDRLLAELGQRQHDVVEAQATLDQLLSRQAAAEDEWQRQWAAAVHVPVAQFAMFTRFMGELGGAIGAARAALEEKAAARDELAVSVTHAKRALEAVEEHRDEQQEQFIRHRQSGEFKQADDQWNTLQQGTTGNGNEA